MTTYSVQNRTTGEIVHAYEAEQADHFGLFPVEFFNHIPQPVPVPPAPVRDISGVSYLRRFTQEERIRIRAAAASSAVLDDYLKLLDATIAQGGIVNLDDQDTVAAVQMLEAVGLINAGRATEILA